MLIALRAALKTLWLRLTYRMKQADRLEAFMLQSRRIREALFAKELSENEAYEEYYTLRRMNDYDLAKHLGLI